jgi:hypothetical protein
VKRGHSDEKEQHAPQLRQSAVSSSTIQMAPEIWKWELRMLFWQCLCNEAGWPPL